MLTDFLINKDDLQNQRDHAIEYARERYDPSTLQPQVDYARERATEGISEGQESIARQRTVESLFRPTDTSIYGGNQARAIAGQQQRSRQTQEALAQFESNLTQQDLQAQQQGQQQFAQARTQQKQTAAKQDAAIEEAEMQYEAELANRRKQLGGAVANVAGTVAGSFLGPAGAAAAGGAAGGLAGGGMGAVQGAGAGFTTAFQREQSEDFINQLTGGEGQQQQQQGDQNFDDTFQYVNNLLSSAQKQESQPETQQSTNPLFTTQNGMMTESIDYDSTLPTTSELIGGDSQPLPAQGQASPQQQQSRQYDFTGGYQNTPSDFMTEQEQNQLLSTLGYNESGQRTKPVDQYEIRQQQRFQTQRLDQTQQNQTQQPNQQDDPFYLGEETYGRASDLIGRLFGSGAGKASQFGTWLPRKLLNAPTSISNFIEFSTQRALQGKKPAPYE